MSRRKTLPERVAQLESVVLTQHHALVRLAEAHPELFPLPEAPADATTDAAPAIPTVVVQGEGTVTP